jgi:hypothetical protein
MKLLEIQGRIETLGRAVVEANSRKYDYVSFVSADGAATHVKKLNVSNLVDAAIGPGAQGVFFIFKLFWMKQLVACKVGDRVAYDELIAWPLWKLYLSLAFGLLFFVLGTLLGAVFSFFIVGLPILAISLFGLVTILWGAPQLPNWRRRVREALRRHGAGSTAVTTL